VNQIKWGTLDGKKPLPPKICPVCGKEFERREDESTGNYRQRKSCSEECSLILLRQNDSLALKDLWAKGVFAERDISNGMKRAWARGDFDGVFQSPTSIELQVAAALDIMGIEHQPQYRPDGYGCVYDELVPPDILIEIHGDYWHGDTFPEQQQRDAAKAQWAEDNGFELVTIWEHEINEFGAWALVMERVAGIGPNDEEGE